MSYNKIITHPGNAHRDDFLAVCVALASAVNYPTIVRQEPSEKDLEDPEILVLDTGGRHEPEKGNLDHHQFPRDAAPVCALTLFLRSLGLYELALVVFPWIKATEILDAKGPTALAEEYKVPVGFAGIMPLLSPIEKIILEQFSMVGVLAVEFQGQEDPLYRLMRGIGLSILQELEKTEARIHLLEQVANYGLVGDVRVLSLDLIDRTDNPQLGIEAAITLKVFAQDTAVIITQDNRGEGWSLYRRNDDPRVDFSRLEGDSLVTFAHKGGFIAKTRPCHIGQAFGLIQKALTPKP